MEELATPIFGIDLGTTYSCIAYLDADLRPIVLANAEGERLTPSVIQFEPEGWIVGREAREAAAEVPEDVVCMVKRQIGTPNWHFDYGGQQYSAEEISSYILRKLATDAYQQTGQRVVDVVITCPAYFGISQREATVKMLRCHGAPLFRWPASAQSLLRKSITKCQRCLYQGRSQRFTIAQWSRLFSAGADEDMCDALAERLNIREVGPGEILEQDAAFHKESM